MKIKTFASFLLMGTFALSCSAKKPLVNTSENNPSKEETTTVTTAPQDSVIEMTVEGEKNMNVTEQCKINLSLFTSSSQNKNYADAYKPWRQCYDECPSISKNTYILGVKILNWKISQSTDPAEQASLKEQLMKLYDDRILYFGEAPAEKASILTYKAAYYIYYYPNDPKTPYEWLKYAVSVLGNRSSVSALHNYVVTSSKLYTADETRGEIFINDYLKANAILENNMAPGKKYAAQNAKEKDQLDLLFVTSPAANCEQLDKIYAGKVAENSTDNEYLQRVIRFYKRIKCTDSEIFFAASLASHKIEPSEDSANGCAEMSFKKEDYKGAIAYFKQAIELSTETKNKAEYNFKIAQIYNKLNNDSQVRTYCKKSLALDPNQSNPHVLLGVIYAQATVSDDPVLEKAKYWAAVDEFITARRLAADEKESATASKLINTYSNYFPSKEDIFMHPDITLGDSYFVGGLVQESTTVRAK